MRGLGSTTLSTTTGALARARDAPGRGHAGLLLAGDPATAASACRTFRWDAAVTPFVAPNALCEAVLLGAGRSYKFLALSTTINAVLIGGLVTLALSARPALSSAWACILLFFVLRISVSLGRIFGTNRSGM